MTMIENIIIIDNSTVAKGEQHRLQYRVLLNSLEEAIRLLILPQMGKMGDALDAGLRVINLNQYELKENPNRIDAAINGIWNKIVFKEVKKILSGFQKEGTIIHIHGYMHRFSPSVLKACMVSGIKTVLTLHDYFILCPCGGFYDNMRKAPCNVSPMSIKCMLCNCDKRSYFQKIWASNSPIPHR